MTVAAKQMDFLQELGFDVDGPEIPGKRHISPDILARYAGLNDIPERQWRSFFPNGGRPWKQRDLEYLAAWWGKDDILSLSYALGREPWNLQRVVCRLRRQGVPIPYLRNDRKETE